MQRTLRQRKEKSTVQQPTDEKRKRKRITSCIEDMPPLKEVRVSEGDAKECEKKTTLNNVKNNISTQDDTKQEIFSDEEKFEEFDSFKYQMSELELLRQKNIKKNQEMFNEFNVAQAKHVFSTTIPVKNKIHVVGAESKEDRKIRLKEELANMPRRSSLRIQKIAADLTSLPLDWVDPPEKRISNYETKDEGRKPEEITMETMNNVSNEETTTALQSWCKVCKNIPKKELPNQFDCSREYCKMSMSCLRVHKVGKITKTRIFSTAVHPMEEKTLIAAGDKWGIVGLWDVDSSPDGKNEIFWFQPHNRPINCLKFSPFDSNKLYSCSYDGSIRYADFEKEKFYQMYGFNENEDKRFNYFTWQKEKNNTLFAATSFGHALLIDTSTGKAEQSFQLYQKSMRCMDIHPLNNNIIAATCYNGTVATWDLRKLHEKKENKPLSFFQASRTNTTCFFSPITGNKLLLTSQDDYLRVFDINQNGHITTPPRISIRHNNHTGRWLTTFRACWDPKTDNTFLCGSMNSPRQLDLYTVGDDKTYSHFTLQHDNLTTVSSVNAVHPSKNIIAGGNASGKMYVWT